MIEIKSIGFIVLLVYFMIVKVHSGKDDRPCECNWTNEWSPVCGKDGRTYSHEINLRCYNKCNKTNIEIRYVGICKRVQTPVPLP